MEFIRLLYFQWAPIKKTDSRRGPEARRRAARENLTLGQPRPVTLI